MDERPVLLCYDGSDDAAHAIAEAGRLLGARRAVVVTAWEPAATWELYDPGALISAGVSVLGAKSLGLDEIAADMARTTAERGVALATEAGFRAQPKLVSGKPWRTICELGQELDATAIVLGARGLSRVRRALLGSVTAADLVHADRPVLVIPR
jgi:nucleotide-binding universal stress UspA family protein